LFIEVVYRGFLLYFLRALPARIGEQARQSVGDGPFPVLEYGVMDFMPGRDPAERFLFPEQLEHNFCLEFRRKVPTRYHGLELNLPPFFCLNFGVHYKWLSKSAQGGSGTAREWLS